jgi:hypothetical protein
MLSTQRINCVFYFLLTTKMLVKQAFESTHHRNLSIMYGVVHGINDVALGNYPYPQRTARAPAS